MTRQNGIDCITIGYNETPIEEYVDFVAAYGEDSEAYRDLQYSFLTVGDRRLDYMALLNRAFGSASGIHSERDADSAPPTVFTSCDIPNLAATYLAAHLERHGHSARAVDLFQQQRDALRRYLLEEPLCVAITTTFYITNFPVNEIVRFIRQIAPRTHIVVGGPLVANHAARLRDGDLDAALRDMGADVYVIESQGEETLRRLVECLKRSGDLAEVPNLAFFKGPELLRTRREEEDNSLDENSIDWRRVAANRTALGPTIQTRTARSCAFKCSFCNYPARAGRLRLAKLDAIERELDSIASLGYVSDLVFVDDTFNVPLPRFKDICRLLIRKQYGLSWFSYFRCSNSDPEAIDLMAESGCKGVFLGIESGAPEILDAMDKVATVEQYETGIQQLRERGIMTFVSLIVGFPGETAATVDQTIQFIERTRPDYYRAQLWYCEEGTPIERRREAYEIEGSGFVWRHRTMDSMQAMDHVDRLFLSVKNSIWLPQWSFDFWAIPYLHGRGVPLDQLRKLLSCAHELLKLEIASLPLNHKSAIQRRLMQEMVSFAASGPPPRSA